MAESSQVDALRKANRTAAKTQSVGLALAKVARFLPSPYRNLAFGGSVAFAGAVFAGRYLRQKTRNIERGES